MSTFKDQSNFDGRKRPIVVNVCNFPPPSNNKPSLLTLEHVTTLFHEFGHALHGLVTIQNIQAFQVHLSQEILLNFHLRLLNIGQLNQNY